MKHKGFTLIEILIVIFIVGVLASAVFVRGTTTGNQEIKATALHLRSLLVYAQQQALLESLTLQFSTNNKGYQFLKFIKNKWTPINTDKLLTYAKLPPKINLVLSPKEIIVLPNGEILPFQIDFYFGGKKSHYHIIGKESSEIEVKDDNE